MNIPRLGVNIDHVATLRQQRGEYYPQVTRAAQMALQAGADQITIHLREDRRHIQDQDVPETQQVCLDFNLPLNFEMGCSEEMIRIASLHQPHWVCLVPEKREEKTTEGGLDVMEEGNYRRLKMSCDTIKKNSPKTKISLFVEANPEGLKKCLTLNADAVEIHTGEYAKAFLEKKDYGHFLQQFRQGHKIIKSAGWGYHAGHGLTIDSLEPLLREKYFEEYNIGHWIISEAIFHGLDRVVGDLLTLIKKYPLEE